MNAMQRLENRLAGKPVDRLPNLPLVMLFAARQIGVPYGRFSTDYRLFSEGAWACYERFGIDMLCTCSDPMREASGFGVKVVIPENGVPHSAEPLLKDISDIDRLRVVDPASAERMNDRVMAVRTLKERSGGEVPVFGWIEGAVAESCDLMDMTYFMMNLIDYPAQIHQLLSICNEQAKRFAFTQHQAGADFIGLGDAASSLLGPRLYEEFALPYQQELISYIHGLGKRVKLHICGNLNPVLPLVAQTGADIVDLDHMVDMDRAAAFFPPEMHICGNFDPVDILLHGNPQTVCAATERCARLSEKNLNVISPGCEVPLHTPDENMLAVLQTLERLGMADAGGAHAE